MFQVCSDSSRGYYYHIFFSFSHPNSVAFIMTQSFCFSYSRWVCRILDCFHLYQPRLFSYIFSVLIRLYGMISFNPSLLLIFSKPLLVLVVFSWTLSSVIVSLNCQVPFGFSWMLTNAEHGVPIFSSQSDIWLFFPTAIWLYYSFLVCRQM